MWHILRILWTFVFLTKKYLSPQPVAPKKWKGMFKRAFSKILAYFFGYVNMLFVFCWIFSYVYLRSCLSCSINGLFAGPIVQLPSHAVFPWFFWSKDVEYFKAAIVGKPGRGNVKRWPKGRGKTISRTFQLPIKNEAVKTVVHLNGCCSDGTLWLAIRFKQITEIYIIDS